MKAPTDHTKALRQHLVKLLTESEAHAGFDDAVKDMPPALQGKRPKALRTHRGSCLNTSASRSGTFLSSRAIRNTSRRTFRAGIGLRRRNLPMKRRGTRVLRNFAPIGRLFANSRQTNPPTYSQKFRTVMGKRSFGRRCSQRTTIRITSEN